MWIYLAIMFAAPAYGRFLCRYFARICRLHWAASYILVHHLHRGKRPSLGKHLRFRCLVLNKSFPAL